MTDARAYDPPADLEGADNGLVEAVAAKIWANRAQLFNKRATPHEFGRQSLAVRASWRKTAEETLRYLFALGFTGPGGPPRDPETGWCYAWNWECNNWEIIDSTGGAVALVVNDQDVPLLIAAPRMEAAITALLAAVKHTPAAEAPEVLALAAALPVTAQGGDNATE